MQNLNKSIPFAGFKLHAIAAFILAALIYFVIMGFQPFGIGNWQHPNKALLLSGYPLSIVIGYLFGIACCLGLLKSYFNKSNWTFAKEVWMVLIGIVTAVIAAYFYKSFLIPDPFGSWADFSYFLRMAATTAFLPLMLLFTLRYFLAKTYFLKMELERGGETENVPSDSSEILPEIESNVEVDRFVLKGQNKDDEISFAKTDLLFLKASDNYVEINLRTDLGTKSHLLRSSLSGLLNSVQDPELVRVHRSYAVYFPNVIEMKGKSPTYFLTMKYCPDNIPVSKSYLEEVRRSLSF